MTELIKQAVSVLREGGVIAYPTEYCFGLGCDPANKEAVQRIFDIKNRSVEQGLILIAADVAQVRVYADIQASPLQSQILASWPGPVTWVLPAHANSPNWISGKYSSIAMRVTAHELCSQLCQQFAGAVVSTSANLHGQAELFDADQVSMHLGNDIDYIVSSPVGGASKASTIKDAMTGAILR